MTRRGCEVLICAPILEPTRKFFPDPWEASLLGLDRVTRRLLQYAGLGELDVRLERFSQNVSPRNRVKGRTCGVIAAYFAGIRDGSCHFGINDQQTSDPEHLAGIMCHEVAHAYRNFHGLCVEDRDEEELLTDLTTVYLGFGLLAVNNTQRYRSSGDIAGGWVYTYWTSSAAGYLPAQAMCFLFAAQLAASEIDPEAKRRLFGHLEPNQAAFVKAALEEIEAHRPELDQELGLPDRTARPEPRRPSDILRPLPVYSETVSHEETEDSIEVEPWNKGRAIFRLKVHPYSLFWFFVFGLGGGAAFFIADSSPLLFALALPGLALDIIRGRQKRRYVCSDPSCGATLDPLATHCPTCGGTIRGTIKSRNERLEMEGEARQSGGVGATFETNQPETQQGRASSAEMRPPCPRLRVRRIYCVATVVSVRRPSRRCPR